MILTNKQALMLLQVLNDCCSIHGDDFPYSAQLRCDLYDKIMSQQSDKLINLEELKQEQE